MRTIVAIAVVVGLVISAHAQAPPKTELEGAWVAVWSQFEGGPQFKLGAGEVASVTLNFTGDRLMATGLLPVPVGTKPNPNPAELRFTLNTTAIPKQIDYWQPWEAGNPPVPFGATNRIAATYELIGEELRMEIPRCNETGPRPTAVSGGAKCSIMLVFKRVPS